MTTLFFISRNNHERIGRPLQIPADGQVSAPDRQPGGILILTFSVPAAFLSYLRDRPASLYSGDDDAAADQSHCHCQINITCRLIDPDSFLAKEHLVVDPSQAQEQALYGVADADDWLIENLAANPSFTPTLYRPQLAEPDPSRLAMASTDLPNINANEIDLDYFLNEILPSNIMLTFIHAYPEAEQLSLTQLRNVYQQARPNFPAMFPVLALASTMHEMQAKRDKTGRHITNPN